MKITVSNNNTRPSHFEEFDLKLKAKAMFPPPSIWHKFNIVINFTGGLRNKSFATVRRGRIRCETRESSRWGLFGGQTECAQSVPASEVHSEVHWFTAGLII